MKKTKKAPNKELFCYVVQSIMDMMTVFDTICDTGFSIDSPVADNVAKKADLMQKQANKMFDLEEDEIGYTYIDWFIESWHGHKLNILTEMYSEIVDGKEYTPKTPLQLYKLMKRTKAFK